MEEERRDIWSSHSLWMLLCCAIPLGGIVLFSLLGVLGSWGFYGLILLCPLLHFFFMRRMAMTNSRKGPPQNDGRGPGR
jgi:hypothetical protein